MPLLCLHECVWMSFHQMSMCVCEVVDYPAEGVIEMLRSCVKSDGESRHCVSPAWNFESKSVLVEELTGPEESMFLCWVLLSGHAGDDRTTANRDEKDKGNAE